MHRPAPQVPRHGRGPAYWMNETSGVLRPAIVAYLKGLPMREDEIAAMRAYLRQWIVADCWAGPEVDDLRWRIDGLTTKKAIERWLDDAIKEGIDPL